MKKQLSATIFGGLILFIWFEKSSIAYLIDAVVQWAFGWAGGCRGNNTEVMCHSRLTLGTQYNNCILNK